MEDLVTGLIQCTVCPMVMTLIWKIVTGWEIYVICGILNNAGCIVNFQECEVFSAITTSSSAPFPSCVQQVQPA